MLIVWQFACFWVIKLLVKPLSCKKKPGYFAGLMAAYIEYTVHSAGSLQFSVFYKQSTLHAYHCSLDAKMFIIKVSFAAGAPGRPYALFSICAALKLHKRYCRQGCKTGLTEIGATAVDRRRYALLLTTEGPHMYYSLRLKVIIYTTFYNQVPTCNTVYDSSSQYCLLKWRL